MKVTLGTLNVLKDAFATLWVPAVGTERHEWSLRDTERCCWLIRRVLKGTFTASDAAKGDFHCDITQRRQ